MRILPYLLLISIASTALAEDPPAATEPPPPAASPPAASPPATPPPAARAGTMDRLELGTTAITGNRELPKVMYVVPWKKADLGDLAGRPANSLLDEVLSPVDRDVFRREVTYFEAVDAPTGPPPAQGETPVTAPPSQE